MKQFIIFLLFAGFVFIPSVVAHCGTCGKGEKHSCTSCEAKDGKKCEKCSRKECEKKCKEEDEECKKKCSVEKADQAQPAKKAEEVKKVDK